MCDCPLLGLARERYPLQLPHPGQAISGAQQGANKSPLTTGHNPISIVVLVPTTKPRQWGMNSGFPHPGCHCTPCAPAGYKSKLQFVGVPIGVPKSYINSPQVRTILLVLWCNNPGDDRPKIFRRWLIGEISDWRQQNRTKSMCMSVQKKQSIELIITAHHYYCLL